MKKDLLTAKSIGSDSEGPTRSRLFWLKGFGLALAGSLVLAIAIVYAYGTAFSYFSYYDDEGYAMSTVRGFLEGQRLYLDVFTYYGPFYFLYQWLLHAVVQVPLTHDATTAMCLVHWFIGAGLLAWAGFRLTRSLLIACLIFMQAALHLTPLAREPSHPQEVVVLLLCLALVMAAGDRPPARILPGLAAIGAFLVFTKINIGVFYAIALGLVLSIRSDFFKLRPGAFFSALTLSALLPFVLMRPNLRQGWVILFSCQSCAAILAAGMGGYAFDPRERIGLAPLLKAGLVFLICAAGLTAMVLFKGTSLSAMLDALVTQPAKLGTLFSMPLKVGYGVVSAGLSVIGAALVVRLRNQTELRSLLVPAAKGFFGVVGMVFLVNDYYRLMSYLMPWSWLVLVPLQSRDASAPELTRGFGRLFLCLLCVWESLQAYPVAGTQAAIGTLALLLILGVFLHDAVTGFSQSEYARARLTRLAPRTRASIPVLVFAGLLWLFATQWCNPMNAWRYYQSVPALGLKGAAHLRLPEEQVETYRALTAFLKKEGDTFYTVPAFMSPYFWTGQAPPTYLSAPERVVLTRSQQQRVIQELERAKHPLIVLTDDGTPVPESVGPLGVLLHHRCREIQRFGMYRVFEVEPGSVPDQALPGK